MTFSDDDDEVVVVVVVVVVVFVVVFVDKVLGELELLDGIPFVSPGVVGVVPVVVPSVVFGIVHFKLVGSLIKSL